MMNRNLLREFHNPRRLSLAARVRSMLVLVGGKQRFGRGPRVWTWVIELPKGKPLRIARMPYTALSWSFSDPDALVTLRWVGDDPVRTQTKFRAEIEEIRPGSVLP